MAKNEPVVVRKSYAVYFDDKSRAAKQSFKDQCNIQKIVEIFNKTGQLIHGTTKKPFYGDFSRVPNFMEVQNARVLASGFYANLPESIKTRFKSVDELVSFVTDPVNRDESIKLGLVKVVPTPPEKVLKVEVVSPDGRPAEIPPKV